MTEQEAKVHLNNIWFAIDKCEGNWNELVGVRKSYVAIKDFVNEKVANNTNTAIELQGAKGFKAETDLQPEV